MRKLTTFLVSSAMAITLMACEKDDVKSDDQTVTKPPIASAADLGRRIEKLASDEFQGRAPATPGGIAASQYIADEMKSAGLEPMGENGTYFQSVELTSTTLQPSSTMTIRNGDDIVLESDVHDGVTNSVFWSKRVAPSLNIHPLPKVLLILQKINY